MVDIESYKEKVLKVKKLKEIILRHGEEVTVHDTDLYPENIDKSIADMEKYINEAGYEEGTTA